jgi:hypothetical protein
MGFAVCRKRPRPTTVPSLNAQPTGLFVLALALKVHPAELVRSITVQRDR